MGDVDSSPFRQILDLLELFFAPSAQGDEANSLRIELGKPGVAGKLGVKDQGGIDAPLHLIPEGKERKYLLVSLGSMNIRSSIEHQF